MLALTAQKLSENSLDFYLPPYTKNPKAAPNEITAITPNYNPSKHFPKAYTSLVLLHNCTKCLSEILLLENKSFAALRAEWPLLIHIQIQMII